MTEESGPGRTYGGLSAADRAAERRRRLLDAGLDVFGSVGYAAATVRQLCREARVADRYFYEEFVNTEDLLRAVYLDCMDRLQDTVVAVAAAHEGDLPELARDGLDAFLAVLEQDRRLARVVWFEVMGVSPRIDATYLGRMEDFGALLTGLLLERGLLTDVPEGELAVVRRAAVGGVSHAVVAWLHADFAQPRAEVLAGLQRFLRAIAYGADAAPRDG